jgi:hypothetical protein
MAPHQSAISKELHPWVLAFHPLVILIKIKKQRPIVRGWKWNITTCVNVKLGIPFHVACIGFFRITIDCEPAFMTSLVIQVPRYSGIYIISSLCNMAIFSFQGSLPWLEYRFICFKSIRSTCV